MIRKILIFAALFGIVVSATAQSSIQPSNVTFRFGVLVPLDDDVQDFSDDIFIGFGLDWFLESSLFDEGETYVSADWYGDNIDGGNANIVPVMINQRWYTSGNEYDGDRSWFSVGLGFAFTDLGANDEEFVGQVSVGKEFSENVNAEFRVFLMGKSNGLSGSAAGVYLGYRF